EIHPDRAGDEFCSQHVLDPTRPIVALLPGSRSKEIQKILPVMLDSVSLMAKRDARMQFVIALAEERHRPAVEKILSEAAKSAGELPPVSIVVGETYDALNAADAAAVTSGTATLETGVIGTP